MKRRQPRLPRVARPDRIAAEYRAALWSALRPLLDLLKEFAQDAEREWPKPEAEA